MTWQTGAASLMVLFAWACHTPAYEVALSQTEPSIPPTCFRPKLELWTTGEDTYLVAVQCTTAGLRDPNGKILRPSASKSTTYLCRGQDCKVLPDLGDWVARVPTAVESTPPTPAPGGSTPLATVDAAGNPRETQIRAQIDARAAAILACTNGETTVVQVEIQPGRTVISLTGKHATTPAEACVRAALSDLKTTGSESLTVRHPLIAK